MAKTVLILCNKDSGIYDFRKELLLRLIKESYRVVVSVPAGDCIGKLQDLGCEVALTDLNRRGMNPLQDLKLLRRYNQLMKEYQPNVILTYTIKPNVYGNLAAKRRKIVSIANVTGLGTTIFGGGLKAKISLFLYKYGLKSVPCVFFQNEKNLSFMKEHHCVEENTQLIPGSGVNLSEKFAVEYPSEEQGIIFLSVMRIMKDKGIEELLDVIEDWKPDTKVIFRLIGSYEPESRQQYEPRIQNLQKQGKLEYYGYRDDSHRFMSEAHVVIHPSYHEGLSNVLLEAAATGRMVIASDIPGCRETFRDGVTGIAIQPKSAAALREAVNKVIQMTACQREEMGQAGRKWVEQHFDREKVVDCYMEKIKKFAEEQ